MARTREPLSLVMRHDAPQVRANRRDGVEALFFAKHEEIAGFDASDGTDGKFAGLAQFKHTQWTRLHGGLGQTHYPGKGGSHGDHRAPYRSQSEKITAF